MSIYFVRTKTARKQSAAAVAVAAVAAVAIALGPPVVVHGEVHILPVVQASPLDVSLGETESKRSWAALAHIALCIEGRGTKAQTYVCVRWHEHGKQASRQTKYKLTGTGAGGSSVDEAHNLLQR